MELDNHTSVFPNPWTADVIYILPSGRSLCHISCTLTLVTGFQILAHISGMHLAFLCDQNIFSGDMFCDQNIFSGDMPSVPLGSGMEPPRVTTTHHLSFYLSIPSLASMSQ